MLTVLGILLLVSGAILTFAVDRQIDGVDLLAIGWILVFGGVLSVFAGMIGLAGRDDGYGIVPDGRDAPGTDHERRAPDRPLGDDRRIA